MASNNDTQWLISAYKVLSSTQKAMHVSEIEELIRTSNYDYKDSSHISNGPSMPLEVLLTKEAAMGRKFTKPDGSPPGYFSLLPPQHAGSEDRSSTSPPATVSHHFLPSTSESTVSLDLRYQQKYHQLKKTCKQMIYLNAALYDDIARVEKKIEKCSRERKVILQKVMADQNITNHRKPKSKSQNSTGAKASESESVGESRPSQPPKRKSKAKDDVRKKSSSPPPKKRKASNDEEKEELSGTTQDDVIGALQGIKSEMECKKEPTDEYPTDIEVKIEPHGAYLPHLEGPSKFGEESTVTRTSAGLQSQMEAIRIPPINLDAAGRPVLPLELPAGLTIYSIGEICEKTGYSTATSIYPVGYCCTRTYAWSQNPSTRCLYTCKISEGPDGPKFEISADTDQSTVFVDDTPAGCHSKLLQLISNASSQQIPLTPDSDFFGLNHPVVLNLLQCSQGASNCLTYQWSKFEVVKSISELSKVPSELDPATSFRALFKLLYPDSTEEQESSHDQSSESDDSTD